MGENKVKLEKEGNTEQGKKKSNSNKKGRLIPKNRFWYNPNRILSYSVYNPIANAQVEIIASKRVVKVGEPFDIKVLGSASAGLKAIWWFGIDTSDAALDKAHWKDLNGEVFYEEVWTGITINTAGKYVFGANSRDINYIIGANNNSEPYGTQASEGAGISKCTVEVRNDISYDAHIDLLANQYNKSADWINWMKSLEIKNIYESVWNKSRNLPTTLKIAFNYGDGPLNYNPSWVDEEEHMNTLEEMADKAFPNLNFDFLFSADPATTDMDVVVGGPSNVSTAGMNSAYLYYETIFSHEFAHLLNVRHHYLGSDVLNKINLPPQESECIMARNSNQFCSGCRAAMYIDLDINNSADISNIISNILDRYPY